MNSVITGKHMPRRTFLRGVGATMALPFLDAMVPAGRAQKKAADMTRLVCIEEVHGLAGCNVLRREQAAVRAGDDRAWLHAGAGESVLRARSLPRLHDDVSNTDVRMAEAFAAPEIGGDHFRSSAVFLTQAHPKQTQGSDI